MFPPEYTVVMLQEYIDVMLYRAEDGLGKVGDETDKARSRVGSRSRGWLGTNLTPPLRNLRVSSSPKLTPKKGPSERVPREGAMSLHRATELIRLKGDSQV